MENLLMGKGLSGLFTKLTKWNGHEDAWKWLYGFRIRLPAKRLENKIGEALQQPQNCFFICVCQKKNKQKELPNQLFLQRHAWKGLDKTELGKHTHDSG